MQNQLYPLIFNPIFKERIWGGNIIASLFKNTKIDLSKKIGEAWVVSDRNDDNSIIENGLLAGLTLKELRYKFKNLLLGSNFDYTTPFPLLVKILHAKEDLSIQVHPKKIDTLLLNNAEEKSEFWYILKSDNANIIAGLQPNIKIDNLINNKINETNLKDYFVTYKTKPNDLYYIKSGLVHAINKGNLILEIQQNSDTTYRVYDYNRVDINNIARELHLKESAICMKNSPKKPIIKNSNQSLNTNLFKVKNYTIDTKKIIKTTTKSFKLISITDGVVEIINNANKISVIVSKYQTALLPANLIYTVKPKTKQSSFITTQTKI